MITTTCEDLRVLVSTGRFLQELYQRLATVEITVPPLSERMDDLPDLVRHFLEQFALLNGKHVSEVAEDAMLRMHRYHWPGNVRELEGVLRKGVLQTEGGPLGLHHLPIPREERQADRSETGASESMRLQDVVEQHVLRVLKDCGGNKLRAAEALDISRSTLYRMLDTSAANTRRQILNCWIPMRRRSVKSNYIDELAHGRNGNLVIYNPIKPVGHRNGIHEGLQRIISTQRNTQIRPAWIHNAILILQLIGMPRLRGE